MKNIIFLTAIFLLFFARAQGDTAPDPQQTPITSASPNPATDTTPTPTVTITVSPVAESNQTLKILNALVQEAETTSAAGRKKSSHCDRLYKSVSSLIEISSHLSLLAAPKASDDLSKELASNNTRGVLAKPLSKSDTKQLSQNLAMMKTTHKVKHQQLQTTFTGLSCNGDKAQLTTAKNLEDTLTQIEYFFGVLAK